MKKHPARRATVPGGGNFQIAYKNGQKGKQCCPAGLARRVQLDLFYDYRTNVALYPAWQRFLRTHQPETLIFWGQGDIFFTPEGGEAYLRDLPKAELHRLDSGHFAVEDRLDAIVRNIARFYDERVASVRATQRTA